jgi:hypothetical protein
MTLIAQRFVQDGYEVQVGCTGRKITSRGIETKVLNSAEALQQRLQNAFEINVPAVTALWPKVLKRHQALFPDNTD